ncbi:hypothetical protein [Microbacterium hominis]|uniref:Uncharacterized protein n=1 Tax=Microbacterium hominis TaxID=162426 RepID=A0A7D4QEI2_9MICO|nr:hypothetical protein [Microbacterium hominis]QKJ20957.1 hypothetical protein HQM25_17370 [Microbacterium hominis]
MPQTETGTEPTGTGARTVARILFFVAAAIALLTTVLYVAPGDRVDFDVSELTRQRTSAIAHAAMWASLTVSFVVAGIRGAWGTVSTVFAVIAGGCFAYHLYAVYFWGGAWPW